MEYALIILSVLCSLIGFAGAILPVLPGPPISYISIWLLWIADHSLISMPLLIIMGGTMVIITLLDYIAPSWLTKIGGGSKYGIRGSMIGLFAGLFCGPWGIIFAPFAGALIGEMLYHSDFMKALKSASFSLLAFLLTTGIKIIYAIATIVIIALSVINN